MPAAGEGTYVCKLSPEIQKIALDELHEDPSRRAADIEHIREWIKKQPHLNLRTDDLTILKFLRSCKFSLERTKEKIDKFYTVRSALPEWFGPGMRNLKDPKMQVLMEAGILVPLRGYNTNGRRVLFFRVVGIDADKFHPDDWERFNQMCSEVLMLDEQTQVVGIEGVGDLKGFSAAHMAKMSIGNMRKGNVLMESAPTRFKGFYHCNAPVIFEKMFNLFKSFMNEKMKKRLFLTHDLKVINEKIPKHMLPEEYGGTGGKWSELVAEWNKELMKHTDYLREEEKYGVDESKRPGKPKTKEDLFGLDGSFRKLEID